MRINTEVTAKDDGCDGWTAKPPTPDEWLGTTETCWQFKAGAAGEPKRLAGEAVKPIPRQTLAAGGRLVVVASGSTNGAKGERDRLATLASEAAAESIPSANIEVIGSERLANWCNKHLAVAAPWAGRPGGLWTFDDWSHSDEHQSPWYASVDVHTAIKARRDELDLNTGEVIHLHIQGPPGVGKTRFALELCREARWRSSVIYFRQADDFRLVELIDSVANDHGVPLVVVADEVQSNDLMPLRDSVGRGTGRIRLITIGHSASPDPSRIPSYCLKPLERAGMNAVVRTLYPSMPPEHVDFVVEFSGGYVRLARLSAYAVSRNPGVDARSLLGRDEVRGFLDRMLGDGDRRPLYVVAVLTTVGWTDEKQIEGEAIARHLGLDWNLVRAWVEDFHRRTGIAPRGGRLRYISPTPLGIYLAAEAWTVYPDLLKSLPNALPTEEARESYFDRLKTMASNPRVRDFARGELASFFRLDDFVDARAVRRWSALSSADPAMAARNVLQALKSASVDDRRRIAERARRETVWSLSKLAWKPSAFHDAVKSLALLAEAENESWANNASAEFVARFQIYLGGTAVPYVERLPSLDELLAEGREALARLVIKALARVGQQSATRTSTDPISDELPEVEWRPRIQKEHVDAIEAAISRLCELAARAIPGIGPDLVKAAESVSMLLRDANCRGLVQKYFIAVRDAYPDAREPLRRIVAGIVHKEKKYWKQLAGTAVSEIESLHAKFEDDTLVARLQQHIGQPPWEREEQPDLTALAREFSAAPDLLDQHWQWLTSGDAADAWRFGEALASVDSDGRLEEVFPLLPDSGRDLRVLSGYVFARRRMSGDGWYDDWALSQLRRNPIPVQLIFEIAWRCGATEVLAHKIAEIIQSRDIDRNIVAQLEFGRWEEHLSQPVLHALLQAMTDNGHEETAVRILEHRFKSRPDEAEAWSGLALRLVIFPRLIRGVQMIEYSWKEMAMRLLPSHAAVIAAAILREQCDRESGHWFAEHSQAADVLQRCVAADPHGVWESIQPYLALPTDAARFSVGFPHGVLERISEKIIMRWIESHPAERAPIIARMIDIDLSNDDTLASQLLDRYGDDERVAGEFFSQYISGSWWGAASEHWTELAETLERVATRTDRLKLKSWATERARSLRRMAQRDREWEEEQELGRR